jgi:hypothetical protein
LPEIRRVDHDPGILAIAVVMGLSIDSVTRPTKEAFPLR